MKRTNIVGGGNPSRGIHSITYRARHVVWAEEERERKALYENMDGELKKKMIEETNAVPPPHPAFTGIVPSICSHARYQDQIATIENKYRKLCNAA